ncbi:MAG: hypothetical protein JXR83_20810 [Deltaproteobacteria bacterium]|nr:hypothetical protein [Deltaproteobacteria bacterium]
MGRRRWFWSLLAPLCLLPLPLRAELPAFSRPTDLPQELVCNAYQGLGNNGASWIDQLTELDEPAVCRGLVWGDWSTLQPTDAPIDWNAQWGRYLTRALNVARAKNKHVWIYFYTDGRVPQWAVDRGVEVVCGLPAPWDTTYHTLLQSALGQLAAQYESDPVLDGVLMMSGGYYGEMFLAHSCDENTNGTNDWLEHGYTEQRFADGCKALVDVYLNAFERVPVSLQIGSGLTWVDWVASDVADYAVNTYGLRIYLTYNGWGGNTTQDQWHTSCLNGGTTGDYWRGILSGHAELSRTGYQPSIQVCFAAQADYQRHMDHVLNEHGAFGLLPKLGSWTANASWETEVRADFARHVGGQPVLVTASAPPTATAGSALSVDLTWSNRGTLPVYCARRDGVKSVPDSCRVVVDVVAGDGQTVARSLVRPSVGTHQWTTGIRFQHAVAVPLSAAVPAGTYALRVGLCDPHDGGRAWRFVPASAAAEDELGRREIGQLDVSNPAPSGALPEIPPCTGPVAPADAGMASDGGQAQPDRPPAADGATGSDGGAARDALSGCDGGEAGDAEAGAGDGSGGGAVGDGCGCAAGWRTSDPGPGWLLAAIFLARRRRRGRCQKLSSESDGR